MESGFDGNAPVELAKRKSRAAQPAGRRVTKRTGRPAGPACTALMSGDIYEVDHQLAWEPCSITDVQGNGENGSRRDGGVDRGRAVLEDRPIGDGIPWGTREIMNG